MKRVAILARVSSKGQADRGTSIDDQVAAARAFAESKGWSVVPGGVFIDAGVSGYSVAAEDRPGFAAMIAAARAGEFDAVLYIAVDRMSRRASDLLRWWAELEELGVSPIAISQEFADGATAIGRFARGALALQAQLESDLKSERMRLSYDGRWKRGQAGQSVPPYGYTRRDGRLEPDPESAETIGRIVQLYLAGESMRAIERRLNEEGPPGPGGGRWYRRTISKILRSPVHRGHTSGVRGVIKNTHKALISPEDGAAIETLLRLRRPLPVKSVASRHILSGLVVCGSCGGRLYAVVNRARGDFVMYRCTRRAEGTDPCRVSISGKRLDALVLDAVQSHALSVEYVAERYRAAVAGADEDREAWARREEERLARIAELDARIGRIYDAIELGAVSLHELGPRLRELREKRAAADIAEPEPPTPEPPDLSALQDAREVFLSLCGKAEPGPVRDYLRTVVEAVTVTRDDVRVRFVDGEPALFSRDVSGPPTPSRPRNYLPDLRLVRPTGTWVSIGL